MVFIYISHSWIKISFDISYEYICPFRILVTMMTHRIQLWYQCIRKQKIKFLWLLSDDMVKRNTNCQPTNTENLLLFSGLYLQSSGLLWQYSTWSYPSCTSVTDSSGKSQTQPLWVTAFPSTAKANTHFQGTEKDTDRPDSPSLWTLHLMKLASLGHAEHLVGTAPAFCWGILTCCCFGILENTPFSSTGGSTDAGVQAGVQPR